MQPLEEIYKWPELVNLTYDKIKGFVHEEKAFKKWMMCNKGLVEEDCNPDRMGEGDYMVGWNVPTYIKKAEEIREKVIAQLKQPSSGESPEQRGPKAVLEKVWLDHAPFDWLSRKHAEYAVRNALASYISHGASESDSTENG